jgi:hypothetical protein
MQTSFSAKLCLILALAAAPAPARADQQDADAIAASLAQVLSLATLGTVTTQDQSVQVTQSGGDYHVRLPLKGFSVPANAAVDAIARPLAGGMWDIVLMTFPSAGTVEPAMHDPDARAITFSIGEQAIKARIDPSFARISSFAADLGTIKINSGQADLQSEQSFDRYVTDGTVSSGTDGLLNLTSQGKATNWRLAAHGPNHAETDGVARTLSGRVSVEGLDRTRGFRLMAASRALLAAAKTPSAPGQPPTVSDGQRQDIRTLVEALSGLMTRFSVEESVDDIRFSSGAVAGATIGRVKFSMAGDSTQARLNTTLDIAMDAFAMASLPPETAVYVPRHFDLRSAMAGVPTEHILALLRTATEPGADLAALEARFTSLFAEPGTRIGIESLTFDSGPMQVTASARFVPKPNGKMGANIHVAANGLDAFIAQAQGVPAMQQGLPMMFMAKGMGRPEGGATVWDIALGDGPITVNGVPFGQPAPRKR